MRVWAMVVALVTVVVGLAPPALKEVASAAAQQPPSAPIARRVNPAPRGLATRAAAVLTVNSVDDTDDGACDAVHCSLREALNAADSHGNAGGPDSIVFNIPSGAAQNGQFIIAPTTPLPVIREPLIIEGQSQSGYNGHPLIVISGISIPVAQGEVDGLVITAGGSTLSALQVCGFSGNGVVLREGGINRVRNCVLGTMPSTEAQEALRGNAQSGLMIRGGRNFIGGATPSQTQPFGAEGNIMAGNGRYGIEIIGGGANAVQGNVIGGNVFIAPRTNRMGGICIDGGNDNTIGAPGYTLQNGQRRAAPGSNLIGGNQGPGITLKNGATRNTVRGGFIGAPVEETLPVRGNGGPGVLLDRASGNRIGTDAGRDAVTGARLGGVVLCDNNGPGVWLRNGANHNLVQNCSIGLAADGTTVDGNEAQGILVEDSSGNTFGGAGDAGNLISGNSYDGVRITVTSNTALASGNKIQGNVIGLDATGAIAGNGGCGIQVIHAPHTQIGGGTAATRNVIAGNAEHGVTMLGSRLRAGLVLHNTIGTNAAGTAARPNRGFGIMCQTSTCRISDNHIAGNARNGIYLQGESNVVTGNLVGLAAGGTTALPNGTDDFGSLGKAAGISVVGSQNCIIGGTLPAARNIVSGNVGAGIVILAGSVNRVQGNYIGTNQAGTAAVPNGLGIEISDGAQHNTIGGTAPAMRNIISGNARHGVWIRGSRNFPSSMNVIAGNTIGTAADGKKYLGNGQAGILVDEFATHTLIGAPTTLGASPSPRAANSNFITGSGAAAIEIRGNTEGTVVQRNAIGMASDTQRSGNQVGVLLTNGAQGVTIGSGNYIAANGQGIVMRGPRCSGNRVQGNYIGDIGLPPYLFTNGTGIVIEDGAHDNTIGAGNTIGLNLTYSIVIRGAGTNKNMVQGNLINGHGASPGVYPLVYIGDGASHTLLGDPRGDGTIALGPGGVPATSHGGTAAAGQAGNTILFHGYRAIHVGESTPAARRTTGTRIMGNMVLNPSPRTDNTTVVEVLNGAENTQIGGGATGGNNFLNHEGRLRGARVVGDAQGTSIRGNRYYSRQLMPIDLVPRGEMEFSTTPNDPLDADGGPNALQNSPTIVGAASNGYLTQVRVRLGSKPHGLYIIDFYARAQGKLLTRYCRSVQLTLDAAGAGVTTAGLPGVAAGDTVYATATDLASGTLGAAAALGAAGDTSEFSAGTVVQRDDGAPQVLIRRPAHLSSITDLAAGIGGVVNDGDSSSGLAASSMRATLLRLRDGLYWNGTAWASGMHHLYLQVEERAFAVEARALPSGAALEAGRYRVTVEATDNAGNRGIAAHTFTVDNTAPVVTMAPLSVSARPSRQHLAGTVLEANRVRRVSVEIKRARDSFYWNGRLWQPQPTTTSAALKGSAPGFTWSAPLPPAVPPGSEVPQGQTADEPYTVTVQAEDEAGLLSIPVVQAVGFVPLPPPASPRAATGHPAATGSRSLVSPVQLSTAAATHSTITLHFTAALDGDAALAELYTVQAGGQTVTVESATCNLRTVTLGLAAGALPAGTQATVRWSGLHDRNGHALAAGTATVTAH